MVGFVFIGFIGFSRENQKTNKTNVLRLMWHMGVECARKACQTLFFWFSLWSVVHEASQSQPHDNPDSFPLHVSAHVPISHDFL